MQKEPIDGFHGTFLDVLMGAVDGVASLEADDRFPPFFFEGKARGGGVDLVGREERMGFAIEDPNGTRKVDIPLLINHRNPRMLLIVSAVNVDSFFFLVVGVLLREMKNPNGATGWVIETQILTRLQRFCNGFVYG